MSATRRRRHPSGGMSRNGRGMSRSAQLEAETMEMERQLKSLRSNTALVKSKWEASAKPKSRQGYRWNASGALDNGYSSFAESAISQAHSISRTGSANNSRFGGTNSLRKKKRGHSATQKLMKYADHGGSAANGGTGGHFGNEGGHFGNAEINNTVRTRNGMVGGLRGRTRSAQRGSHSRISSAQKSGRPIQLTDELSRRPVHRQRNSAQRRSDSALPQGSPSAFGRTNTKPSKRRSAPKRRGLDLGGLHVARMPVRSNAPMRSPPRYPSQPQPGQAPPQPYPENGYHPQQQQQHISPERVSYENQQPKSEQGNVTNFSSLVGTMGLPPKPPITTQAQRQRVKPKETAITASWKRRVRMMSGGNSAMNGAKENMNTQQDHNRDEAPQPAPSTQPSVFRMTAGMNMSRRSDPTDRANRVRINGVVPAPSYVSTLEYERKDGYELMGPITEVPKLSPTDKPKSGSLLDRFGSGKYDEGQNRRDFMQARAEALGLPQKAGGVTMVSTDNNQYGSQNDGVKSLPGQVQARPGSLLATLGSQPHDEEASAREFAAARAEALNMMGVQDGSTTTVQTKSTVSMSTGTSPTPAKRGGSLLDMYGDKPFDEAENRKEFEAARAEALNMMGVQDGSTTTAQTKSTSAMSTGTSPTPAQRGGSLLDMYGDKPFDEAENRREFEAARREALGLPPVPESKAPTGAAPPPLGVRPKRALDSVYTVKPTAPRQASGPVPSQAEDVHESMVASGMLTRQQKMMYIDAGISSKQQEGSTLRLACYQCYKMYYFPTFGYIHKYSGKAFCGAKCANAYLQTTKLRCSRIGCGKRVALTDGTYADAQISDTSSSLVFFCTPECAKRVNQPALPTNESKDTQFEVPSEPEVVEPAEPSGTSASESLPQEPVADLTQVPPSQVLSQTETITQSETISKPEPVSQAIVNPGAVSEPEKPSLEQEIDFDEEQGVSLEDSVVPVTSDPLDFGEPEVVMPDESDDSDEDL